MPRADFYIVPEPAVPYRFVCQLAEKVRNEGYDIYIHAATREEAGTIDDLLWTFRDTSFVPHAVIDSTGGMEDYPVIIGWKGEEPLRRQVLINLSAATPGQTDAYDRIIEVVPSAAEERQQARLRYKDYRARGLEMHSHNIESTRA
ncbi:MAG: DNA polymerase III subunit chi [Gammaproteobacteria bacterium]|nr:DNA polymerase III subunit chi [Gammaproteobacteria bacterium]